MDMRSTEADPGAGGIGRGPDNYEAIRRLLHVETGDASRGLSEAVAVGFVENALLFLDREKQFTVLEIAESVRTLFDLRFETGELRQALRNVTRRHPQRIAQTRGFPPRFGLTQDRRSALEVQVQQFEESERGIFAGWAESLRTKWPDLSDQHVEQLLTDQQAFNKQVLLRYGAQCEQLLAPAEGCKDLPPRRSSVVESLASLPQREPQVADIREEELLRFWSEGEPERVRYLSRLLDNVCLIHTAHIDPKASALVRGVFADTVFYLDTNVLYRALNLQGPHRFFQMRTVLDILSRVGARRRVSQATLQELRTSLRGRPDVIQKYPIASRRLADLAAQATSETDFVSLYLAEYARSGIGVDDFAALVRNVESLLISLGIEIDQDNHQELMESPSLDKEKGLVILAAEGEVPHDAVVTHDALHRLLVLKVRNGTRSFAQARAWFLTCDGKLGLYDRMARGRGGSGVPFCIYPDQCVQMTRWMLPRTDDYDRAFVQLVCSPHVVTLAHLPSEAAHLVCARIDRYARERGISEQTAEAMAVLTLVDKRLESGFRKSETDDERMREIDDAMARALQELDRRTKEIEHARTLAAAAAVQQTALQGAQVRSLTSELAGTRETLQRVQEEGEGEHAERLKAEQDAAAEREARETAEKTAATAEAVLLRLRWVACTALWGGLFLCYWLLPWAKWPGFAPSLYRVAAFLLASLVLGLPLGFRRAWPIILGVCAVGQFISFLLR